MIQRDISAYKNPRSSEITWEFMSKKNDQQTFSYSRPKIKILGFVGSRVPIVITKNSSFVVWK